MTVRFTSLPAALLIGLLLFSVGCAPAEPVSDLSQGQTGRIYFPSSNPTAKDLLVGNGPTGRVNIFGTLEFPDGANRPVPAAVILHGISGVTRHYFNMADDLLDFGFATFVVDSHEPRDIGSVAEAMTGISYIIRTADAYAALRLLATHPRIDRTRIVVIGTSYGGGVTLFAASETFRRKLVGGPERFAAHVAYYPSCWRQLERMDSTGAPILMLLAERDNITPMAQCRDYGRRMKKDGASVKTIVYQGAHHGFDISFLAGRTFPYWPLRNYSECADRFIRLKGDGTWVAPKFGKEADTPEGFGNLATDCEFGHGTLGGPEGAREQSIADYRAFLKEALRLP